MVIVVKQSGIARGYYTEMNFVVEEINKIKNFGAHIDATYFCPHHPKEGIGELLTDCNCRKPKTGLIMQALKEWNLDKKKCFLIGDKESDIIAANRCGISSFLFSPHNKNLLEIFKDRLPSLMG